jgi:hypothetical protein
MITSKLFALKLPKSEFAHLGITLTRGVSALGSRRFEAT